MEFGDYCWYSNDIAKLDGKSNRFKTIEPQRNLKSEYTKRNIVFMKNCLNISTLGKFKLHS